MSNHDSRGYQKNVIQGKRSDRKTDTLNKDNKITKLIHSMLQKKTKNSNSTKNWAHGSGAPLG